MKRKRGHKKGNKSKKPKVVSNEGNLNGSAENAESQNSDKSSEAADEQESRMEVDAPSSTGSDHSLNISADRDGSADNTAAKSIGRVKVKLKTSKAPEPDTSSRNDVAENVPQTGSERSGMATERKEDYVPPLPERKSLFIGNVYRKTKGIKIKPSKAVAGSCSSIENASDPLKTKEENVVQNPDLKTLNENSDKKTLNENSETKKQEPENEPISLLKGQKKADQTSGYNKQELESPVGFLGREQKKADSTSQYNKQELEKSLTVIKKVMKMDAAEPFNVPVNPEALGIPDYFDIIHTPMDFGTICNNLEKGEKYKNSADVYKDVQYIWDNCCKYNKKGDYILDLMKRVKKNYMKYWTAAGLYTEQSTESTQLEDGAQSSLGKGSTKGSQLKQKSHKRHGRHHKSDCMCAVCILKRRKREREHNARIAQGQSGTQEEYSPVASPSIENSSLNMGEEQDMDTDVDNRNGGKSETVQIDSPMEEKQRVTEPRHEAEAEEEGEGDLDVDEEDHVMEIEKINEADKHKNHSVDRSAEEPSDQPVTDTAEKSDAVVLSECQKSTQHEEEDKAIRLQKQKELRELQRKEWRAKMHEKFHIENPKLLPLCEALFPNEKSKSIWSGPHSLFNRRGTTRTKTSSVHEAIETFMK
ncbi:PREDICTED: bromodomain testis-specific protein [Tarenaya hassleriana]|uniref:bromodomain testis-specific protein n=1 Tax=Tarenaya hassleriana TaxID=28532 RepID=UPI00053C2B1E|nr:PREDICTED: bromodomain testis-specific protein [Tarenaya hassleriana]XP_010548912.1 PREDICTED: bromodomain testis-specific protein [Tarenaya hassleriana]